MREHCTADAAETWAHERDAFHARVPARRPRPSLCPWIAKRRCPALDSEVAELDKVRRTAQTAIAKEARKRVVTKQRADDVVFGAFIVNPPLAG